MLPGSKRHMFTSCTSHCTHLELLHAWGAQHELGIGAGRDFRTLQELLRRDGNLDQRQARLLPLRHKLAGRRPDDHPVAIEQQACVRGRAGGGLRQPGYGNGSGGQRRRVATSW